MGYIRKCLLNNWKGIERERAFGQFLEIYVLITPAKTFLNYQKTKKGIAELFNGG